jgi:RNA polymerase sigma-70 factor (ECF subfamily)
MVNRDEFEQTALPSMNVLHKYALHLTSNSEKANDLLQETYLKAFRFWSRFRTGTNINAWLFRIMKNSYINRYRTERSRPPHISYEEHHVPPHADHESSLPYQSTREHSYDTQVGDEILHSLQSIDETYRNVVILGDLEGLSYKEIADTLDCPIGTVRSRLHRGRKLLKERLFAFAKGNGYIPRTSRM